MKDHSSRLWKIVLQDYGRSKMIMEDQRSFSKIMGIKDDYRRSKTITEDDYRRSKMIIEDQRSKIITEDER